MRDFKSVFVSHPHTVVVMFLFPNDCKNRQAVEMAPCEGVLLLIEVGVRIFQGCVRQSWM